MNTNTMRSAYSSEFRQLAVERWRAGNESCADIALALGCSVRALYNWTRGLKRNKRYRMYSDEFRARAVQLYVEGLYSGDDVAYIMGEGLTKTSIVAWVKEAGFSLRPSGYPTKEFQRERFQRQVNL